MRARSRWIIRFAAVAGALTSIAVGCFVNIPDIGSGAPDGSVDAATESGVPDGAMSAGDASGNDAGIIHPACGSAAVAMLTTSAGAGTINDFAVDPTSVFIAAASGVFKLDKSVSLSSAPATPTVGTPIEIRPDGSGGAYFLTKDGALFYFDGTTVRALYSADAGLGAAHIALVPDDPTRLAVVGDQGELWTVARTPSGTSSDIKLLAPAPILPNDASIPQNLTNAVADHGSVFFGYQAASCNPIAVRRVDLDGSTCDTDTVSGSRAAASDLALAGSLIYFTKVASGCSAGGAVETVPEDVCTETYANVPNVAPSDDGGSGSGPAYALAVDPPFIFFSRQSRASAYWTCASGANRGVLPLDAGVIPSSSPPIAFDSDWIFLGVYRTVYKIPRPCPEVCDGG